MRAALMVMIAVTMPASAALADIPPGPNATVWMVEPGHVWVSPGGTGPSLSEAYAVGWPGEADATIHLELRTWSEDPIVGYPAEDMWYQCDGIATFAYCAAGTVADAPTDAEGRTTFSQPPRAGGQILGDHQPQVMIGGSPVIADLPLSINSPDVNGDLAVTLADLVPVVQALQSWPIDPRADFNVDGQIDLADIVIFVSVYGTACP
ncbi:hypothetical protein GF314_06415 [bacterium]|nr:hypothetical protein [bacterium]